MAIPQIWESDVDALLQEGELVVDGHYAWEDSPNKTWLKLYIPVTHESRKVNLKLCVTLNQREPSIYSFALILNNAFRVRGLDVNGSHGNHHTNSERWIGRTHKHRWTDPCRDRFAYTPIDIISQTVEEQLNEFCVESGIKGQVTVDSPPARQDDLFDEV